MNGSPISGKGRTGADQPSCFVNAHHGDHHQVILMMMNMMTMMMMKMKMMMMTIFLMMMTIMMMMMMMTMTLVCLWLVLESWAEHSSTLSLLPPQNSRRQPAKTVQILLYESATGKNTFTI